MEAQSRSGNDRPISFPIHRGSSRLFGGIPDGEMLRYPVAGSSEMRPTIELVECCGSANRLGPPLVDSGSRAMLSGFEVVHRGSHSARGPVDDVRPLVLRVNVYAVSITVLGYLSRRIK